MSDTSQGPGWWQASDDKWYPPDQVPGPAPAAPPWGSGSGYGPTHTSPPVQGYGQPQGYGQAPGYGYPMGAYPPAAPSAQGMAVASMVLGILALVLFWCWFLGIGLALVGLPLGLVARTKIAKGEVIPQGMGQATAGIACSAIALVLALGILVLFLASS